MIEYEIHKNVDLIDTNDLSGVEVEKGVIYNAKTDIINPKGYVDDIHRKRSLATVIVGLNNTASPLPTKTDYFDAWADIDAQEIHLNSKPTCYLILSKPGAGAYSLGEAISKKLNCVHICPKNILADEIDQQSSTGKCIHFNMKNYKKVQFDTILKLLQVKMASPAISHRGYVISGFPIVSNTRDPKCLIQPLWGEEALEEIDDLLFETIRNLKKKPKNAKDVGPSSVSSASKMGGEEEAVVEEEEESQPEELPEEEEEIKVELPKFLLNTASNLIHPQKIHYITRKEAIIRQLEAIFNLEMKPDIIIYISCPDKDLQTKKSQKYINYKSASHVINPFVTTPISEVKWPLKYNTSDYVSPIETHTFNFKYNCRQPMNFKHKSVDQICNYKNDVLPFIENKLKDYEPKYIIRVDGRQTTHQMMHNISERLNFLSIKPVLIPEPMYLEEPPEDMEEFWKNIEEMNGINEGVLSFKRYPSLWFNRCPVELKYGKSCIGKPKLAVSLFKHIYLLSSLDAMVTFCRNPRPYLKLKYLEPTCRIIVTGTKSSGKTLISECLSWIFDVPLITYDKLYEKRARDKYDVYAKRILSEIIATIEDARLAQWEISESARMSELKIWCQMVINKLKKYILIYRDYLEYIEKVRLRQEMRDQFLRDRALKAVKEPSPESTEAGSVEAFEISAGVTTEVVEKKSTEVQKPSEGEKPIDVEKIFEMEEEIPPEEEANDELIYLYENHKRELSYLPILDNLALCKKALDFNVMSEYAPANIKTPINKPALPIMGDKDVTAAIEAYIDSNDLRKEMEPTVEEMMNDITKLLSKIDSNYKASTAGEYKYGKFIIDGFPTDPEFWSILVENNYLPDYTVALIENKEMTDDLWVYYTTIHKYTKNHQERYMLANDPLIKFKKTSLTREEDANKIINDLIDKSLEKESEEDIKTPDAAAVVEGFEKCKENLDTVKIKLEEKSKCYIDVELDTKTDIQLVEAVLQRIRKGYFITFEINEEGGGDEQDDEEIEIPKDMVTYNNPVKLCETNIYCPIAYYDHGVLWEGKSEFSLKYDNNLYNFCKEECLQIFQQDINNYLSNNVPFKKLPPLRICVIGAIGSGKTTISQLLAKELGLMCIDFSEFINNNLIPRHFKKVGRRYENPFTDTAINDEAVVEFQMGEDNENLISDILSNETELRRMVYNYFETGSQIVPPLMQQLIIKLWFQEPFVSKGFILDGYPRLPTDVEDMVTTFCIPDLVIELEGSSDTSLQRLSNKMFKTWKIQLTKAKEMARQKIELQKNEWLNIITKNVVPKLIVDDILENMFEWNIEPEKRLSQTDSVIMDSHPSGASSIDQNLFKHYQTAIEEYPEPVDATEWPKAEEVRENIDSRIESIYEIDDENIQGLKDVLLEQRVKVVSVNGMKSVNKVIRSALPKLTKYRNRSESLFEQTYIISLDIAELLISGGFYLLSKFNRMCPVNIYENPEIITNAYNLYKKRGNVYPICHRAYIYFICGKESVTKFRNNPLKYILSSNITNFIEYPLRISIIGPPKSGKSSLTAKIAKKYGLMCISRGIAIRYTLENLHWTELASIIDTSIRSGECVDTYNVLKAVQNITFDHRVMTYGYVLDGFPESSMEAMELCKMGIYPNIIFDISSNMNYVLENSQNEIYKDILKNTPPYSSPLIEQRFIKWKETSSKIRDWINNDIQNIYPINGNDSKWQCSKNALRMINIFLPKVHNYLINVQNENNIVRADVMGISNEIFQKRMSDYKNVCPVCLSKNILKHSSYPNDRQGIVQYQDKFYWICSQHLTKVLKNPHLYLKNQKVNIPEIPAIVKVVDKNLVYENGVCIVTYAENLPSQKIVRGSNKFAVNFKGTTYMFCGEKCLAKFLAKPVMYADITVFKHIHCFPQVALQKLPNIGYLEQTVGNIITEACCSVNVLRPKYPGLDFQLSALLYIALYLKTHNPRTKDYALPKYLKAFKTFDARCKLINDIGLFLRSMDNPFATYPKCCSASSSGKTNKSSSTASETRRVPVPDQRFDYLCEYHKPVSKVPAFLNVVDIAGLVRGAAEGQGLGNAFLSHIKACDAIFNLCRAFDDEDVIHVDGDVNPVRDLETIGEELRLKDEEQLLTNIEKLDRVVNRGGEKKLKPEYDSLMKIKTVLVDEKKHIRFGDWSAADIEVLNKYLFLTSKPALYLVNLSEKDYTRKKNKWLPKLKEWIDKNDPGAPLIPFSGVFESKLLDMDPEERQAFLKENNVTSALDKIIVQGYKALQLEYFFTAGPDEVKAWTIQKGTKAPQAAGRIHTDFEKGFIMAEVMHYKDFKEEGSEAACKSAGKYRQQGRNYVVEDGDIIFFKFNAGAGLKDAKKK